MNKREAAALKRKELTEKYGRDPADMLGELFHPIICVREGCGKFKDYHQYLSHDFEPPADADLYEFIEGVGWKRKA